MRLRLTAGLLVTTIVLAACADDERSRLDVSAAASLTDVFDAVEAAYEAAHPDVDVELNLAGSTTLVEQVLQGAPVDVLVTADEAAMARALDGAAVDGPPQPIARNRLVLAFPAAGPDRELGALADDELLVGLCAATVPCGAAAQQALAAAGITPAPDTEEPDVRSLLAKLVAGELDVGLVYATDVIATNGIVGSTELPVDASTTVVAATVATTTRPDHAADFLAFLATDTVRDLLRDAGFEVAP